MNKQIDVKSCNTISWDGSSSFPVSVTSGSNKHFESSLLGHIPESGSCYIYQMIYLLRFMGLYKEVYFHSCQGKRSIEYFMKVDIFQKKETEIPCQ